MRNEEFHSVFSAINSHRGMREMRTTFYEVDHLWDLGADSAIGIYLSGQGVRDWTGFVWLRTVIVLRLL